MRKLLAASIVALATSPSFAAINATVVSPAGTFSFSSDEVGQVTQNADGTLTWVGSYQHEEYGWGMDWNYTVDGDPSIAGVAAFTNLMANPANFSYDISANSDVTIVGPTVYGASTITLLDANANSAAMDALAGDSIYNAHILAQSEKRLFEDPFGLAAPPAGIDFDGTAWGPQPAISPVINLGDLFGIDHDFRLSAGDQATLNSSFFITPEPTTLLMLLAGGSLVWRRRR